MKTFRFLSFTLGLSCTAYVLTLSSCSPKVTPSVPEHTQEHTPLSLYQEEVRTYLANQLDKEAPDYLPQMLALKLDNPISPKEIDSQRRLVWQLWSQANAPRYESNQGHLFGEEVSRLLWKLPANEYMPIELFTKGARPKEGYALYINLHGGGKDPNAPSRWGAAFNDREWEAARTLGRRYADTGSVYFVPRMADDRKGRWYLAPQRIAFRRAWQLAVLGGQVNPNRIYLLGISEGGYGSHRLALYMPDYFAGIGPMAAAEPVNATQNLRNVAFRLAVGAKDTGFGRNTLAQAWSDALAHLAQTNPGDFVHQVQIQEGRGHGIDYFDTTPWLEQHTRRNYPHHISYRYYNMTADYPEPSYSSGVYYLDFRGLKPNGGSLDLDLVKQGNDYNLTLEHVDKVSGKLRIYLDEVNYSKPIIVRINGRQAFQGLVRPTNASLVESLALWGDPTRLYPAYVEVSIQ